MMAASENARALRSKLTGWLSRFPVKFFEPLTLGELEFGQKFIVFPEPGDNTREGLRLASFIHTKIEQAAEFRRMVGWKLVEDSYPVPHSRVVREIDGSILDFPDSTVVLWVK